MKQAPPNEEFEKAVEIYREETAEGLSDARASFVLRRIQAELSSEPRRAVGWWWRVALGVGLAAGAVALGLLWFPQPAAPRPPQANLQAQAPAVPSPTRPRDTPAAPKATPALSVVWRSGQVTLERTGPAAPPARETTALPAGSRMRVAQQAQLELSLAGAARVAARGGSTVTWREDLRFELELGSATFSVRPHAPEAPFIVHAGDAEITVVGTRFELQVEGRRLRQVRVEEGVVEVRRGKELHRLGPGQALDAAFGTKDTGRVLSGPWWDEVEGAGQPGYLEVDANAAALAWLDGQRLGSTPLLVRWAAGPHTVEVRRKGFKSFVQSVVLAPGETVRVEAVLDPEGSSRPKRRTEAVEDPWQRAQTQLARGRCAELELGLRDELSAAASHAQATMLVAECRLRRGDKRAALQAYQDVAQWQPESAHTQTAAFQAATLLADLGRASEAEQALERYLRAWPTGMFSELANFRRCELMRDARRLGDARACAEDYRARHPAGVRSAEAVRLLAGIARAEARWAEAAALYRAYAERSPKDLEEARYRLAECLRAGRLPGLAEAVEDYLRNHPQGPHAAELTGWRAP